MPDNPTTITLKENLTNLIVEHLRTGEKLPSEKEMIREFGVSRTALREVLSAFEANGIIVSRQGSGYYVQTPSINNQILDTWGILLRNNPALLLDLLEIRRILEVNSLPTAVGRVNASQLQYLGQQVETMRAKAYRGETFVKEDREFHKTLAECTNNIFLVQLLTTFWDLFERNGHDKPHEDLIAVAQQHEDILKAFAKQDIPLLTELLEEQFKDSRYQITKSLMNL